VDGAVGFRNFLVARREVFIQTMTEKLLTYALGRAVDYYDMPAVRKIVHDASRNDYKFSSIVMGIIDSSPFQMRMKQAQPSESATATTAAAETASAR
jgi:Protein of unknown function (DUF1585)